MILLVVLAVLLPALTLGNISVEVEATTSTSNASVYARGVCGDVISDLERETFGIDDDALKDAVHASSGERPTDVFVRSPTPWRDLYTTYGWYQVKRTLKPREAKLLDVRATSVVLAEHSFVNNASVTVKYDAAIMQKVEQTVDITWIKFGELTVQRDISVTVNLQVTETENASSITFGCGWGHEKTHALPALAGSESPLPVALLPGRAARAHLEATHATLRLVVLYTATLDGDIATNYAGSFHGHHFYAYDVNSVLANIKLPTTIKSVQHIDIGFYTDAKIVVTDSETNEILMVKNCIIRPTIKQDDSVRHNDPY